MTKQSDISGQQPAAGAAPDPRPAPVGRDAERGLETKPLSVVDLESAGGGAEEQGEGEPDDATVLRPTVRPGHEPAAQGSARKNTLASAITRPVQPGEQGIVTAAAQDAPLSAANAALAGQSSRPSQPSIPDEMEDEADEWTAADQPTVYMPPKRALRASQPGPEAPARPGPVPGQRADTPEPQRGQMPSRPRTLGQVARPPAQQPYGGPRYASPTGRPMPATPPEGISRAALPDPRMQRFQELRQRRLSYQAGEQPIDRTKPVAETVRQWWSDLKPGLENALHYQREARASGVHPIPPHVPVPTTMARLGDAFGRLAASARELTGKAQAAVAPALKRIQDQAGRLHDEAEQHAGAIVGKIEGAAPVRQQAPLLGPGRIAVFFKQGVSVPQAQGLLATNRARPIRLIPRKHGVLAFVPPGSEAAVAERLRQHPYVRDVEYLQFDEFGQPIEEAQ